MMEGTARYAKVSLMLIYAHSVYINHCHGKKALDL